MTIICKASRPVFADSNGHTLTPYVADDGEIWLASEGNGCGDDVMLHGVYGWPSVQIVRMYAAINLDAMREAAEEFRSAGLVDAADWLRDEWCDTVAEAMARVRYGVIDERHDGTGSVFTEDYESKEAAVNAAERAWGYLTDLEKGKRHVCATWSIADDDGEFDWGNYDVIKEFRA